MKALYLTAALAPILLAAPALAQTAPAAAQPAAAEAEAERRLTAWEASRVRASDDMVSTGVARARDRLDSATSTSSLPDSDILRIGETSLGAIFRTIPGIRSEAVGGEANSSYTIRGLPMVGTGAKYLQFQENGLPVLEFGDILALTPDYFLRYDFNVASVESIRGGSASTFASNAPGGVINIISHTGEVEGGSVQVSTGVDYDTQRVDFSYGGHLSDTLRYHVGGFYREGEGLFDAGFDGNRGGQFKFNVTKDFDGGFFRVEGKFLDDRVINYGQVPMLVSGTNSDPTYADLPNFSVRDDTLSTGNIGEFRNLNGDGNLTTTDFQDGNRVLVRSIGFQTRFNLGGWTVQEHMRFADQSGNQVINFPLAMAPAALAPFAFGARPGGLAYATGPNAGQAITNPAGLNGNGLIALSTAVTSQIDSLDNFTNDLRISRVWSFGGGDLTTTAGVYASEQALDFDRQYPVFFQDIVGGGQSSLIDIINTNGTFRTQDGFFNFFGPAGPGSSVRYDVDYSILAPYGSVNYRTGPLALGASVRFDSGQVRGQTIANGATDVRAIDVDGDGVLSEAERTFAFPAVTIPVGYDYDYTSWSVSANYRVSENFSTFGRYSSGGRAAAEKILRTVAIDPAGGGLTDPDIAYDPVDQAEIGFKFRTDGLFANLTGFWAEVSETNQQIRQGANGQTELALVSQAYKAIGAEFEGGIRRGPFSLTGSATWTSAEITDAADPTLIGNTPRHQADLIYALLPQYDTDLFTVGASIVGTTESYSQDVNGLVMPAYTTVNAFLQVRPIDRVVVSLNANNLFDELALVDVSAPTVPANGLSLVRVLPGRNVSASVRFYF
ncbi:MAG TPA: TonB-dependent receptor [Brevundimonas sp.]|uniref:TonB-dependent receptor domain-containing protein n=1 Tax=Brevundimonas sp. TaxID=1871086 RepID=UPI002E113BA0|nr:TonB-dependent receptor [Brevundimonas sp.]